MHLKSVILLAGVVSIAAINSSFAAEPSYHAEDVFDPAVQSHGHVHASCLVECPNGDLRAVWYENGPALPSPPYYDERRDKSDDVRIGGSRKAAGADGWETPFVMSDTFGTSDNNPTMTVDHDGRLWLFHAAMLGAPDWSWGSVIVRYLISADYDQPGPPMWVTSGVLVPKPSGFDKLFDGIEKRLKDPDSDIRKAGGFTAARASFMLQRLRSMAQQPIRQRLGWMPRAHALVRSDGTVILPLSNENFEVPMMAMTADGGQTWTYSAPVPDAGLIQPSLVEFPDGTMAAYFRNGDPRHLIKRSTSTDGGMTWTVPELTDRLHPGGGLEALLLANGHLALVYNNKEEGPRDKLAISISTDKGQTWRWTRQLEDTPGGRFDYPSIIQSKDGTIHVTYSYNLETIKYVRFNEEWVQEGGEEQASAGR